ncbi:hypothetical protein [Paractinoplanes abujensis]|uniref:Uncharacterized protein n=1 Tax=Paractinoplanes abujensis TaxID=882441 RepID=A0A7W7CM60_9ACTN|nr:hypothetical protein [Actinoplanes abujensis]MBB4691109.1 hypothetical protein [Actinoplanes abujensis]
MITEHEAAVDALLRKPFPETAYGRRAAFGGADHHVVRLSASPEFWEDRSEDVVGPAREAIEGEHDLLAQALSARWGPAESVSLLPPAHDDAVTEFFGNWTGEMLAWSCPEFGRWVGLAVVQADPELPFELFVAVSNGPHPPGDAAPRAEGQPTGAAGP